MPTIKDVAREAGVSIATVSYVLNNKKGFISQKTRQEVLDAVDRVGYTPNTTARNLKSSQTRLIGYAWHKAPRQSNNSVLDSFIYYLAQAVESAGYHLLTFTHPSQQPLRVYDELMRSGRVDAFVIADTNDNDERIKFLIDAGFPFVSFGRSKPNWEFSWVDTDGHRGVREAVDYLVGLGHKRIAMAAWPAGSLAGNHRVAGYMEGMTANGLALDPSAILHGEHNEHFGRAALTQWFTLSPQQRPTAVIAISDLIAIGIMNEAEERGLVIGRDLSVIGFDDAPLVQYLHPGLTTVQQAIPEIAEAITQILEDILKASQPTLSQLLIPPRLVIRSSCGQPLPSTVSE
ncbi:MAG: LacI family DNA-binding transcriptional regulator [Anaerolineaceae bacterium]|nr:LacI family DNA-binding transcriptional regulator [Anaerolineaceae bacterium]